MNSERILGSAACALAAILMAAAWQAVGPPPALADGMVLPYWDRELYEPVQVAFLRHDEELGIEHMTVMPKIWGAATDFAWVVPVPALPELAEADPALLEQLSSLSRPRYRSRDGFWNCENQFTADPAAGGRDDLVEIVDERIVGIYQTMTLAADDAGALVDSLSAWGFLHEGNLTEVTALLDSYVQDDWYFVAMRVDSTAFFEDGPASFGGDKAPVPPPYYDGPAVQPITFSFAADGLVYPLRISSVSAYEDSEVYLYTAASHRLDFPGAEALYANRLTAGELQAIRRQYPTAGALLKEGDFLTKLHRGYTPQQMTADIVLTRAPDDGEFLPITYSGFPVWSVVFLGTAAGCWVRRRRRGRRVTAGRVTPAS